MNKPKFFLLTMFPYPSAATLHIGHWYNYAPVDTYGRYKRLKGFDVFQPMGFDSFGLPAENYAIEKGIHPKQTVIENVNKMLEQFDEMYTMYDGIDKSQQALLTSAPEYYKWTQYIFGLLVEKKLVKKQKGAVNWCPKCKTVLANEQVKDSRCERCSTICNLKVKDQWYFKITQYKEKLLENLKNLDYPQQTINAQKNWLSNLQDWCVSRQRYWGCPIPIVYEQDANGNEKPILIPRKHFPWTLPEDVDFTPDGQSPLSRSKELKNRVKNLFSSDYTPEYDTMDTFVCSSFYWLQYLVYLKDTEKGNRDQWLPVDLYVGGAEHACMHLVYARFVNHVLHEINMVPNEEPFKKVIHQGHITSGGIKMSKSKGNAVDPSEYVKKYGTDAFRMALMFMGPYEKGGEWNENQISKISSFLEDVASKCRDRIYNVYTNNSQVKDHLNKLLENVDKNTEKFKFNKSVANFMEFYKATKTLLYTKEEMQCFLAVLWSYAPKTVDELWKNCGFTKSPIEYGYPNYKSSIGNFAVVKLNGEPKGVIALENNKISQTQYLLNRASKLLGIKCDSYIISYEPKLEIDFQITQRNKHSKKKYELVDVGIECHNGKALIKLFRIKALKDFAKIKSGDMGGFVEGYHNLSQENTCWIYKDATVRGNARVSECALMYGSSQLLDESMLAGNAVLMDETVIRGKSEIMGNAMIGGKTFYESVKIKGFTKIINREIEVGTVQFSDGNKISLNSDPKKWSSIVAEHKNLKP